MTARKVPAFIAAIAAGEPVPAELPAVPITELRCTGCGGLASKLRAPSGHTFTKTARAGDPHIRARGEAAVTCGEWVPALVVALALLLAGCGGGIFPEPAPVSCGPEVVCAGASGTRPTTGPALPDGGTLPGEWWVCDCAGLPFLFNESTAETDAAACRFAAGYFAGFVAGRGGSCRR